MKFKKAIKGFGTLHSLKRFAGAYVVDHSKLSEEETISALEKVGPQYFHAENVRIALERCFLHPNREVRTIAPVFLGEVLLNADQFMSAESETDEKIIHWEQNVIDESNEALITKKSARSQSLEIFKFVLSVAWDQNDSISVDEKNLIDKLKAKLLITDREYRTMEASLGKFPRPGNAVHTRDEIDEVRRVLQSEGLLASARDTDKIDYDVIPEEIALVMRTILGIEIRRYGYEQLIDYKYVRKKDWLRETLEKCGFEIEGNPNLDELKEAVLERVKPSILLGGTTPRDGINMDELKKWCSDLATATSGTKAEIIERIIGFYDNLTSRDEESEDQRELWYQHYERFAARDIEFLRSQQLIAKDLEIEARFEDATDYLFEVKLGHKPLKMVASEHADGMLSHGDALILWDNKSKESAVTLGSHLKQFSRYINQQEKRVSGFIVIGPSFTENSVADAMRYQVENGTAISLITASELKEVAEEWSKKDKGTFPLGYLVLPGRFNRNVVAI